MNNTARQSLRLTKADFGVAIAFTKTVHILYTGTNGVAEWREIEPHEMRETRDGNFLIVAMCRLRGDCRTFRLDRVSHYKFGTRGFSLPWPEKTDPEEVTNWWTIRSRSDHEILQVELDTTGSTNSHAQVFAKATRESGRVRAVCKAEGGVSIRRLRRKDVLAWR